MDDFRYIGEMIDLRDHTENMGEIILCRKCGLINSIKNTYVRCSGHKIPHCTCGDIYCVNNIWSDTTDDFPEYFFNSVPYKSE